jgi:hypothetical protein
MALDLFFSGVFRLFGGEREEKQILKVEAGCIYIVKYNELEITQP